MGPKSNDKCPYKRQKRHGEERMESHVTAKVNVGVMYPEAKECLEPPKAAKNKTGISPRILNNRVSGYFNFKLLASRIVTINFYCFKLSNLW